MGLPDFLKKVAGALVKKGLPKLAGSVIPGGEIVVNGIFKTLGIEVEGKTEEQLIQEINVMPVEKLAILKEHEQRMEEFEIERRAQDLANVKDAREKQMDLKFKSPHFVLGLLIVATFLFVAVAVVFSVGPELEGTQREMALLMIGYLAAGYKAVENFIYGSSLGSKRKTDILANGHK